MLHTGKKGAQKSPTVKPKGFEDWTTADLEKEGLTWADLADVGDVDDELAAIEREAEAAANAEGLDEAAGIVSIVKG